MKHRIYSIAFLLLLAALLPEARAELRTKELSAHERAREAAADRAIRETAATLSPGDRLRTALTAGAIGDHASDGYDRMEKKEKLISLYTAAAVLSGNTAAEAAVGRYRARTDSLKAAMTDADRRLEEERQYYRHGAGRILCDIAGDADGWAAKGEYETTDQWKARLSGDLTRALDSICFIRCHRTWKDGIRTEKLRYDADTESLLLAFSREDGNGNSAELTGLLAMPLEEARLFTTGWIYMHSNSLCYAKTLCTAAGLLMPAELKLAYQDREAFRYTTVKLAEGEHYSVRGRELPGLPQGLQEQLRDYVFDYNAYAATVLSGEEMSRETDSILDRYETLFPRMTFEDESRRIYTVRDRFYTRDEAETVKSLYRQACAGTVSEEIGSIGTGFLDGVCEPASSATRDSVRALITRAWTDYAAGNSKESTAGLIKAVMGSGNKAGADLNEAARACIKNDAGLSEGFAKFDRKARKRYFPDFYLREPHLTYLFIAMLIDDSRQRQECLRVNFELTKNLMDAANGKENSKQGK